MPILDELTAVSGFFLLVIPGANAAHSANLAELYPGMDLTGTIVRLIAFLLGMAGSMYLAAVLWRKAERGSESWKYLSISMIMFVFWNAIMTFAILLDLLYVGEVQQGSLLPRETYELSLLIVKTLDPVIEVMVFLILFFGLKRIINTMREKPWTVFSDGDNNE